ncbi:ABC transporter permease [Bacillaceae bacterium Marseille-Q3522]|nr:ABC transporter permease [Bacillaceae bacterium Marseille-Q3522]
MNVWESFKIAFNSIWNHKVRSILTMLGIIIGVCAVIIIVAIGQGAKKQMTDELFGTDKNIIEVYYEPIQTEETAEMVEEVAYQPPVLTREDLDKIREVPGVKAVFGTNSGYGTLVHNEAQGNPQITGVDEQYIRGRKITVVEGRPFFRNDIDGMGRVVMIDTVARDKYFQGDEEVIGELIELDGNPFKVIGVYESAVPEQYRYSEDGEMLMSRTLISMMLGSQEIEQISILGDNPETVAETGRQAAQRLTEIKNLEDGMYTTFDMSEYENEINSFLTTMTLFIGSIAGISLLVGGIGVMNIMLVSVTERTREIGLRKALGATRGRILLQFLIEAMTLTSLGGLLGIGLASLGAFLVSQLSPFGAIISPLIVIIGISFSALIGIVFGILPANKASKLNPIDALRYE